MTPSTRAKDWAIGGLILALAAALRIHCSNCEPLWLDEGYSWWDAAQSLGDLWRLVPLCDPHPPLYAVLLKGWIALFGDSAISMRGLSTLLGVLATAFVMLAGHQIDRRIGWIAGLLFAVAPFQIEYALEARPYTLVSLGAAMLIFGLLRVLRDESSGYAGWAALVLGGALSLWSNNTAVFTLAAAGFAVICVLWREPPTRRLIKPLFYAGLLIVLLWLPYLPVYLEQARGVSDDFWIPRPDAWRVANELRFVVGLGSFNMLYVLLVVYVAGLVVLWRRGRSRQAAILIGLFVFPVALNFAVSLLVKPIFIARALIGIAPAFALGLAAALAAINHRLARFGAVGILIAACVWTATELYQPDRKEPWHHIAAAVAEQDDADTIVIVVPNELALPLGHAMKAAGMRHPVHGAPAEFPAPGLDARYPSGKCAPSVIGQDLGHIAQLAAGKRRVLFITRRNNVYDAQDDIPALLERLGWHEGPMREYMPGFIQLRLFERSQK